MGYLHFTPSQKRTFIAEFYQTLSGPHNNFIIEIQSILEHYILKSILFPSAFVPQDGNLIQICKCGLFPVSSNCMYHSPPVLGNFSIFLLLTMPTTILSTSIWQPKIETFHSDASPPSSTFVQDLRSINRYLTLSSSYSSGSAPGMRWGFFW